LLCSQKNIPTVYEQNLIATQQAHAHAVLDRASGVSLTCHGHFGAIVGQHAAAGAAALAMHRFHSMDIAWPTKQSDVTHTAGRVR